MTLDEAIQHCIDKSQNCNKCGEEHKQLAQWLQELKEYRKMKEFEKDIMNTKSDIAQDGERKTKRY